MTHICVGNLTIIGPDNGLSPGRRQAIIWTNAGILLIGPWVTNSSEILSEIHTFWFNKMHLKMLSGKWRPFCLSLNVLRVSRATIIKAVHIAVCITCKSWGHITYVYLYHMLHFSIHCIVTNRPVNHMICTGNIMIHDLHTTLGPCLYYSIVISGIILGMGSANERKCYIMTSSPIGWTHIQTDKWISYMHVYPDGYYLILMSISRGFQH